jgi:hypothetical protein
MSPVLGLMYDVILSITLPLNSATLSNLISGPITLFSSRLEPVGPSAH